MLKNFWRRACELADGLYGRSSVWNGREKITHSITAVALVLFLAWFFYRSWMAVPILLPVGIAYLAEKEKEDKRRKKEELRVQFKDMVLSLAASVRAGYAIENAFAESYGEMSSLYGSEEIYEFAEVFRAAKRSGGNLAEIMEKTAAMISERIDTFEEIKVAIAAKQMEQNIMNIVPFGIVFYISITSPGFFDGLYKNPTGMLIMTGCLALYLGAYALGKKMTGFERM